MHGGIFVTVFRLVRTVTEVHLCIKLLTEIASDIDHLSSIIGRVESESTTAGIDGEVSPDILE